MNEPINQILEMIRTKRKAKGITQETMAKHLNMTQGNYKNIETGRVSMRVETLFEILSLLDTDIVIKEKDKPEEKNTALSPVSPSVEPHILENLLKEQSQTNKLLEKILKKLDS